MNTNLTAHYMAIETERTRLPGLAKRGQLVEAATAGRRECTGTMAAGRQVGALLGAMASHRSHVIRQFLTHIHPVHPSAQE